MTEPELTAAEEKRLNNTKISSCNRFNGKQYNEETAYDIAKLAVDRIKYCLTQEQAQKVIRFIVQNLNEGHTMILDDFLIKKTSAIVDGEPIIYTEWNRPNDV